MAGLVVAALVMVVVTGRPPEIGLSANPTELSQPLGTRLVYLREVDGRVNLWLDRGSLEPSALTDEPIGIWDYSSLFDGRRVVFSSMAADGSDDIVLVDVGSADRTVLVDCQTIACRQPHWQPGGHLVAYEAHAMDGESISVWLMDAEDGRQWPAFSAELQSQAGTNRNLSRYPRWSADGRLLSFFVPEVRAIFVLEMGDSKPPMVIPANLDLMGDWSPTGLSLAYSELTFGSSQPHPHEDETGNVIDHRETALFSHLVVTDLSSGKTDDLSQEQEVDDGQPDWRPDALGLVANRTKSGEGRQLWIYGFDERSWQPLTHEPLFHHTAPVWSHDGRYIAFMRQAVNGESQPAVWLLDVESQQVHEVMEGAFLPGWL